MKILLDEKNSCWYVLDINNTRCDVGDVVQMQEYNPHAINNYIEIISINDDHILFKESNKNNIAISKNNIIQYSIRKLIDKDKDCEIDKQKHGVNNKVSIKKDSGKPRVDLIPPEVLMKVGQVYGKEDVPVDDESQDIMKAIDDLEKVDEETALKMAGEKAKQISEEVLKKKTVTESE